MFLPHPRVKVSIVGSLRDREVACSASDRQGSNFESCVWRTVSSQSSHHPQEVLLAQFSLYVHKGGLKPESFHFFASLKKSVDAAPPSTKRAGGALKKINFTVYHSRGYTASCAALRCVAPQNESWEKFIFHGAAFFGVALWPITLTRSLSFFNAPRGVRWGRTLTDSKYCTLSTGNCVTLQRSTTSSGLKKHKSMCWD